MNNTFTKKDLKTGMVVELRNGKLFMVINNYIVNNDDWDSLIYYNEKLFSMYNFSNFDIVKIYRVKEKNKLIPQYWFTDLGQPIWTREEEKIVDWSKIPKFTKVQVRGYDYEKWKNAYFLEYDNINDHKFYITFKDKFTYTNTKDLIKYKYCRLYDGKDKESEVNTYDN